MDKITSLIKEKLNKENTVKILVVIGIIGMLLILISSFIPAKTTQKQEVQTNSDQTKAYQQEMEKKLTETLASINGVGEVKVMLTVASTDEYVYAEEVKQSKSNGNNNNTQQNESKLVMVDNNGQQQALIQQINKPSIKGVVVVCQGGGSATVCENVYKTVSTVLGIPISKIYVTQIK